jgi:nicotinamide-nucleotide amidase
VSPERVVAALQANGQSICTAESITGGAIASALVGTPGASKVFTGGVITYSIQAKRDVLGVTESELAFGVVSAEVATAMAQRARILFGTDYAISSTGVAGPGPSEGIPAGTVWLGFASKHARGAVMLNALSPHGERNQIRAAAVVSVFELFFTHAVFALLHPQS